MKLFKYIKSRSAFTLNERFGNRPFPGSDEYSLHDLMTAVEQYEDDVDYLESIASNPSTPPEVLDWLSYDYRWFIRSKVSNNTSTSAKTLTRMSRDSAWEIRSNVASNPSTPISTLEEIASSESDIDPLCALARNPNVTSDILYTLAKAKSWAIREAVASKRNLPEEILISLSDDSHSWVRVAVAQNTSTPADTLIKLSRDLGDPLVSKYAMDNPNFPRDLTSHVLDLF